MTQNSLYLLGDTPTVMITGGRAEPPARRSLVNEGLSALCAGPRLLPFVGSGAVPDSLHVCRSRAAQVLQAVWFSESLVVFACVHSAGHQDEILDPVVPPVPVDVVNYFSWQERATELLGHDEDVFSNDAIRTGMWVPTFEHEHVPVMPRPAATLPTAILCTKPRSASGHQEPPRNTVMVAH